MSRCQTRWYSSILTHVWTRSYKKTLATDGVAGLYRGFLPSVVGIVVYRGLYFGMYDSLKPALPESLKGSFLASFLLGWGVT